jgi:hypothetical protein
MFLAFLSLMAGVTGCLGAVLAGRNAGSLDLLIGWVIGLGVGFGCFVALRKGAKAVLKLLKLSGPKLPTFRLILSWLLCFVCILWIITSAFLGYWSTKLVIHLCL